MGFEYDRNKLIKDLREIGATVIDHPRLDHYLLVNNKYEICYTNFHYFYFGSNESLGSGKKTFFDLIKSDMNKSPEPLVKFEK